MKTRDWLILNAHRFPTRAKAVVACMSRRICVDMYNAIVKFRPDWHSDDDDKGEPKIVMSGSVSDTKDWQPHIRSKHDVRLWLRGLRTRMIQ